MPKQSNNLKQSKRRSPDPVPGQTAYTVDDFCTLNRISRSKFYEFIQFGKGPKCFFVGGSRRISVEAAEQWRRQMEMDAHNG